MGEGAMDRMHPRAALITVIVPLVVVAAALVGGFWASGSAPDTRSSLTAAIDSLPADTAIGGFTDWTLIRQHLDLGSASSAADRAVLNDDASLRDLTTRSVIGRSVEEMHDSYGWSAADVDWEVFGQAADGAAMVAHLDRSVSLATVRARLRALGYVRAGRIWTIGGPSETSVSPNLSVTLAAVAIDTRQRLVVAADRPTYVSTVLDVVDREQPSLLSVRSAADVASALVGTETALLQVGSISCESTTLKEKDDDVQAQGRAAVARAGGLVSVEFSGRGISIESETKQSARFAMAFSSATQASSQLQVRRALATGPLIGGNGRVEDSLVLTGAAVKGSTATLRFDHDADSANYMGGTGPLLFASCPD